MGWVGVVNGRPDGFVVEVEARFAELQECNWKVAFGRSFPLNLNMS